MEHIIRQQYLHVEMHGTEADAVALYRRLPAWCQHELTPALAQVLDRCATPLDHLRLERLEINVGELSLERMEHSWAEAVAEAVEKSLQALLPTAATSPAASDNVQRKTAPQSLHEALAYFLNTGRLPWSLRLSGGEHLEQVLLHSWREMTTSATSSLKAVLLPVLASATARTRLLNQFSATFHAVLLAQLAPEAKAAMDAILLVLRDADVPAAESKVVAQQLWAIAFASFAARHVLTVERLVGEVQRCLPVTEAPTALDLLAQHWPAASSPSSVRNSLNSKAQHSPATSEPSFAEQDLTALPSETSRAETRIVDADSTTPLNQPRPEGKMPDEASEGIYLDCAGLVLLHPFLPRFFTALGIVVDDELVQPERALCLLHYLATGQKVAPEYELILPKILCNVPLETSVAAQVEFTAAELEEAEALLNAVIRHWEVLRDSSIESLRGTFLVRAGKVSLRGDGDWLLQVEAKGFDILLDQLPWGIGMIQLPWMPKMLWVEWR